MREFGALFVNNMMLVGYGGLFVFFTLSLIKMYVNRKSIRLPVHLALIIGCVLLWSLITVLRFIGDSKGLIYIFSLAPYAFSLFSLVAALFFMMRFHNLITFCKPHIIAISMIFPVFTLLNIGLGYPIVSGAGKGINLIRLDPVFSPDKINYLFGDFGPWFYLQFTVAFTLAFSMVVITIMQHVKLPRIYRAPSEKLMIGTIIIAVGFIGDLINTSGGYEYVPIDFALIGFVFSIHYFYAATLGNQGLVFLTKARNDIIQNLDQSVLFLDEEWNIVFRNQKASDWLDSLNFTSDSYPALYETLADAAKKYEKLTDEEGGSDYHFDVMGQSKIFNLREKPILDNKKRQIGAYVIYSDVTENRALIQRLEVGAGRDALTGLHNRSMMDQLKKEMDTPDSLPLSVIICDLNDLKKTNDVHGHQSGDIMLRVCGEALSSEKIPPTAQAGRIGGDEFLMLLPQTGKLEAESVIEEIREYLKGIEDYPYKIIMSMGCSVKDNIDTEILKVMEEADKAMYANKKMLKGGAAIRNMETQLI